MTMPRDHFDESELASFLDDQLEQPDRTRYEAHVDSCDVCRAAVEDLRADARRISQALVQADVDPPVMHAPDRPRAARVVRIGRYAAAAIAASVLVLLAISPVRAWVGATLSDFRAKLSGTADPVVESSEPRASTEQNDEPDRASVSIPVTGNVLNIRLANRQDGGTMTVSAGEVQGATAEIVGGGGEELVVSDGLTIINEAGSTASYNIRVRHNLAVEVTIANEPVRRRAMSDTTDVWKITLQPG